MTIVNLSDISIELFVTVMFFLLIIAPLVSLGVLRLFQGRKKAGFGLIGSGVIGYFVFQLVVSLLS
ncbi:hypothetical protein J25TS5_46870 [Paenibacillus faecis]|uniref:Uncharacterized protein n=1 Tax=Paenibacillus faecis TaxID=862114 RepID=A0A5D0CNS1_9BACL|nr:MULTISPECIES: hypothetical protein [Paenibacillus]MCA1294513.1 hypothetical protein [Paenibacillus sp. alder61]TYA10297.1 hypothetical protein FRY98_27350 [Paenibacillus faecis]GIO87755.1 hypothetical protein J25TS5_46870 [Paenibacillus faecis]